MRRHSDFILTPITSLLDDAVAASAGVGVGIQTFPLGEYVLQSVFLKMTGFQEQKMKCICWEMATHDFDYRYERYTKTRLGECSSYKEKSMVYKDLIGGIKKHSPHFSVSSLLLKNEIKDRAIHGVRDVFQNTSLSKWAERSFLRLSDFDSLLAANQFGSETNLLENGLQDRYEDLYDHRNRCAHNTMSYQHNLPTLEVMEKVEYEYDNYFVRFSILILLDDVFIRLYKKYLEVV